MFPNSPTNGQRTKTKSQFLKVFLIYLVHSLHAKLSLKDTTNNGFHLFTSLLFSLCLHGDSEPFYTVQGFLNKVQLPITPHIPTHNYILEVRYSHSIQFNIISRCFIFNFETLSAREITTKTLIKRSMLRSKHQP